MFCTITFQRRGYNNIFVTVSFDLYYSINLVTTFSSPLTRDTRNYQLLVICHARSNVSSLNLSLKKKVKTQQNKSQSCVKIVKLPIKKLLVFFFGRQGLSGPNQIRSGPDNPCLAKKILIIDIY